jgi:hypothetical protein
MAFPLIIVVAVSVAFGSVLANDHKARLALGHIETATGHVVLLENNTGCGGRGQAHEITFEFAPPGGPPYRNRISVCDASAYRDLKPGDPIPVQYLVADPSVNDIPGTGEPPPFLFFLVFPIVGLFVFVRICYPAISQLLRGRRIFKTGLLTRGTILFVKDQAVRWPSNFPGIGASTIFVTFTTRSGERIEARTSCSNRWLLQHLGPGAEVHVGYLSEKPEKAILLEAYIR